MSPASNGGRERSEVWRFELVGPDVAISAPEGAKPVMVGFQTRAPYALCVWLRVFPDRKKVVYPFVTTATGEMIPEDAAHVGSAQSPEGLVWHVWWPHDL